MNNLNNIDLEEAAIVPASAAAGRAVGGHLQNAVYEWNTGNGERRLKVQFFAPCR